MSSQIFSNGTSQPVSIDDPVGFDEVSRWIAFWETSIELYIPQRDAILYDPEGTTYGWQLADSHEYRVNSRQETVNRGDLVIVPEALAVDAGPTPDLIAFRYR